MSHDRGCWCCGRDQWDYDNCPYDDCVKASLKSDRNDKGRPMEVQQKTRPTVFVVQSQLKRGPDGTRVPKYDLTPATDYGDLTYLLDETHSAFRPNTVLPVLRERLAAAGPDDYLLPIGNPVFIGMASFVMLELVGSATFLIWSAREQRYVAAKADACMR